MIQYNVDLSAATGQAVIPLLPRSEKAIVMTISYRTRYASEEKRPRIQLALHYPSHMDK
jgi:hypothetical protein